MIKCQKPSEKELAWEGASGRGGMKDVTEDVNVSPVV
jgi:hypothetical protein